jgi:hypothetical protein
LQVAAAFVGIISIVVIVAINIARAINIKPFKTCFFVCFAN